MALYENVAMNIVDGRECGGLSHRWPCPPSCYQPIGCPPYGTTAPAAVENAPAAVENAPAAVENALAYSICEHEVNPGQAVPYESFVINSPGKSIVRLGDSTLLLQPGAYAVTFEADAAAGPCAPGADLGAELNLSSGEVGYAQTLLRESMLQDERLTIHTILNLPDVDILTVINNTKHKMLYRNASMTVIRLGQPKPR